MTGRRAVGLLGLVAGLTWRLGLAEPEAALRLENETEIQPLGAYTRMFEDPTGGLDLAGTEAAYARGEFRPLPSAAPSLGFIKGATWVRFDIENPASEMQERWLEAGWNLQDSYVLYLVDDQGRSRRLDNGARVPIARRPIASRAILFPVKLTPGERQTGYLRIAGHVTTVVDFTLWQPAAYLQHQTRYLALKYLGMGATVLVMVFSLLAWRALRRPGLLAMIPGQAVILLHALSGDGFVLDWIPADSGFWSGLWLLRGRNLLTASVLLCHVVFARSFLNLPRYGPRWSRLWPALIVLCVLMMGIAVLGLPQIQMNALTLIVTGTLTLTALAMARHKGAPGLIYLVAWGGLFGAIILCMVQAMGWLSGTVFINDLWLVGLAGSGLTLTYALYLESEGVRAASEAAQARLLALEQNESERLARAVDERTEQLTLATERAEAAYQAKSAFLSTVSHELRTPLHTILGYAHLLGRNLQGEFSDKLAVIERSGAQLLRLIDEVLQFSRGESRVVTLEQKPVSLESLGRFLEETSRVLAEKRGNRFVVGYDPTLPEAVEADEQRLLQVLFNLIGNACKYTKHGTVRLRIATERPPETGADGVRRHRLRFEVEDDGIGIAPEDQERIFEPFGRAAASVRQPGAGLGLAIARQLVQAMDGDIGLDSAPGRGSRFFFTLSLREAEPEAAGFHPATGRIVGYRGPQLTLMVADDIAENRTFLQDLCTEWGFRVALAADGEEALARCRAAHPSIAAVLVDQFMPHADGWDFLRETRATPGLAKLPVVLISAAPPERPPAFPPGLDFDGVLLKPIIPEQLADLLEKLLGLHWRREAPPPPVPEEAGSYPLPPPERLAEFREMLALGQVLALRRWADALALAHPDCAGFAREVAWLAEAIDLNGLERLLNEEEWEPQNANSTGLTQNVLNPLSLRERVRVRGLKT